MRIISGRFKGRVIEMPKGIRPTSDKVREALFEIFKSHIEGTKILDLYCGSGAIGIEALSRGAKSVTFVDKDFKCITALKNNLRQLGLLDLSSIDIYRMDAVRAIEAFEKSSHTFDIIFLDPPYYKEIAKNTLIALSNCDILTRNVIIVAELYKKESLPKELGPLRKIRTSQYGDTKLEFFKRWKR